MKRRSFLAGLIGLAVAPASLAQSCKVTSEKAITPEEQTLATGRIGTIEGFSFYETPHIPVGSIYLRADYGRSEKVAYFIYAGNGRELPCDGRKFSMRRYKELAQVLEANKTPDLRAQFLGTTTGRIKMGVYAT